MLLYIEKNLFMKSLFIYIFILIFFENIFAQRLYIFIPTEHKAVDIENRFREKCSKIIVRSFGNVTDFTEAVSRDTPDAVIAKPQLISLLKNYAIKFHGICNGKTTEPFFLLTLNNTCNISDINGKKIGVLDFLGRENISAFTSELVDGTPNIIRVKKTADLVPLLSMNLVDGVLVSESQKIYINSKSQMKLNENKCKKEQKIVALALYRNNNEIVSNIKTLPAEITMMIGVDGWE